MRKVIPSFIFTLIFFGCTSIFAQETKKITTQPSFQEQKIIYKKIEVVIEDDSDLNRIAALGIDLHCGANMQHKNGKHVATLELSTQAIEQLKSVDFQPKVLIEDMADFYEKRGIKELPKARQDLQQAKAAALYKNAEAGQDLGCSEDGFPVPQNFELGSMGGVTTYQEMLNELDQMRSLYPNLITARTSISSTKTTIEGRDIFYVKLSDNPDVDENEAEVLYTGVHHAREPLSMTNQLYYMWYLLENYATDQKIRNIVDNTELYFIPVVNPDGYLYNQQTNPNGGGMWRKNRRNNGNGTYGVDLNRNYSFQWGLDNSGSSPNSSSDVYRGTGPFSEPETQMMRDFVQSHNFTNAFNNHSYSNLMLRPWGYTGSTHAKEELYDELSEQMCWHNRYQYGNSSKVIYSANGEADDWFYGIEDILAWTPEIGSGAEGGFWPSPSNIVPQCERQMKMSLILASSAANYGILNDLTPYGLDAQNPTLDFSVEHMSNIDGAFTVTVSSNSPYVTAIANATMSTGVLTQANFGNVSTGITLAANTPVGAAITFDVVLNNGTYNIHTTTITKVYDTPILVSDNGSNINNWTSSGGWGVTNSTGYSGSNSIADSPFGNMSTATRTLTLSSPLDLSDVQSPVLEYYTKWDISRLFDFVQIEVSTNGSSWAELCGTYTKPGSSPDNVWSGTPDQPTGEGLYDGFQKEWVREQIDLSAYAGVNTLYIRFKADGDTEKTQSDGFYFDDFTVYREPLGHCENGVQDADETDVDCGGADCIACPTCSDGIQNGNETGVDCGGSDCAVCPPEYCPAYDFNADPIIGYDAGQDFGSAIIQDGGATVYMDGNVWKAIAINYTVTANTVLKFDFKSTVEGEIHEIGFDNDLIVAPDHRLVIYGNQGYAGTFSGDTYDGSGNWQSFAVPIGSTFTGAFTYLILTADDDASSAGNSFFRNIKIYEDEDGNLECDDLVCVVGSPCDDGDACTTGETYDNTCNCTDGTLVDTDTDSVCDSDDQCPGTDDALIGTSCDDLDVCTTGDIYDANCNCAGTFADADGDGVCDADDVCPLGDDNIDADDNGTPDACDASDDCPTVDFTVDTPATYGGSQDQGTLSVQDGGTTIELNDNAWKMITVNYNVTANTVVEFDFKSSQIGEIHGVGFDNNTSTSSNYTFKVYGTQNWGNLTFDTYSGSGSYEHFTIPVGQFYTGQFPYFFFVTDHDDSPKNGNSFFSNLQIYEDTNGDGICDGPEICADADADGVCDADDICANGDDNIDTDRDGTPDACDICPNDPTDSCDSAPTYCGASGSNTNYEYIDRVIFGNVDNTSGENGGYADFTGQVANIGLEDAVPFGLMPGFANSTFNETWMIWIDFNRDGDFDDAGEAVYTGTSSGTLSGNINIPASASIGLTGMRVAMQWNNPAATCGSFTYGEVEDYTVNILSTQQHYTALTLRNEDNLVTSPSMRIYPNPSTDFISIDFQNIRDNGTIEIYDLSGKSISEQSVESESDDLRVKVSHLPSGSYIIRLKFDDSTYATERFVKLSK